jgi:hypothetical protein
VEGLVILAKKGKFEKSTAQRFSSSRRKNYEIGTGSGGTTASIAVDQY